jgi:cell division protein ZapA
MAYEMGQVSITLNGRTYSLACRDDEEERVQQLADYVRSKVDQLVDDFGQIGGDRLMLMSALLIADELFEARENQDGPAGN